MLRGAELCERSEVQLTSGINGRATDAMASDPLADRNIVDIQLVSEVCMPSSSSRSTTVDAEVKVSCRF